MQRLVKQRAFLVLVVGFLVTLAAEAQDIVLLNDVEGNEVQVAATDLIKAYQKYTAAKAREAKTNAPLENEQAARTYARNTLYYSEAQADAFAKPYGDLSDAKERLAAHQAWYRYARNSLYMSEPRSVVMANQKCALLNSETLLETYSKNYSHARNVLYKSESQAMAYAEEMLKKVAPK